MKGVWSAEAAASAVGVGRTIGGRNVRVCCVAGGATAFACELAPPTVCPACVEV